MTWKPSCDVKWTRSKKKIKNKHDNYQQSPSK